MVIHAGARGPGHLSRQPSRGAIAVADPPAATGEVGSPGTYFGYENAHSMLASSATYMAGIASSSDVLGGAQTSRTVKLPVVPMPTTGDWAFCFAVYCDRDSDVNQGRLQTVASIDGATVGSGNGGGLQWAPLRSVGSLPAHELQVQRNAVGNSYHLFGPGGALFMTGVKLVPGEAYLVAIGASGPNGKIAVAQVAEHDIYPLADRIGKTSLIAQVQHAEAATVGARPSSLPLFDILGSQTSAGDKLGFGGQVADFFFITGVFPSDSELQQLARGEMRIADIPSAISGATLAYHNKLDWAARSGTSLAATVDTISAGAATLQGINHSGGNPIRQGTGIGLTLDPMLERAFTFPLQRGATTGRAWAIGTCSLAGYPIYMRLVDAGLSPLTGKDWTKVANSSPLGEYRVFLDGVPKSARFHVEVCLGSPATSNHVVRSRCLFQFGVKALSVANQSELNTLFLQSINASTGAHSAPEAGGTIVPPVSNMLSGAWGTATQCWGQSSTGSGHNPDRLTLPGDRVIPSNGIIGDGFAGMFNRFRDDHDCGLHVIVPGKSGHNIGSQLYDDQVYSRTYPSDHAGGTDYSGLIQLDDATARTALGLIYATTNGWLNHIRPGTVSLSFPGGVNVVDSPEGTDVGQTTGNLYLSTDLTTPIGTVTYNSGYSGAVISITFPSAVAAGDVTKTWRSKQITNGASQVINTTWSAYSIWNMWEDMLRPHLKYGFTCYFAVLGTANLYGLTSGVTQDYSEQQRALGQRVAALIQAANPDLPAALSDPDSIVFGKMRDTSSHYGNLSTVRHALRLLAADSGDAAARSDVWWGGDLYDQATGGPHPSYLFNGSYQVGRHMGRAFSSFLSDDRAVSRGPRLDLASITFPSANVAEIPAILGAGRSLTVNAGYGPIVEPDTDADITVSAGNPNTLDGFFVNGTLCDNTTNYIAAIKSGGQAIQITKVSGSFAGTETFDYLTGTTRPSTDAGIAPPISYVYDDLGDQSGYVPGRPLEVTP